MERLEVDLALPGRGSGEHADDDRANRSVHAQSSRGAGRCPAIIGSGS